MNQMYRPKEAGQVLRIGLTSVYKLVREKKLRAYYLNAGGKRMMRISQRDLEKYIESLVQVGIDTVEDTVTGSNKRESAAIPMHIGEITKSLTA
jgi:excisionase family DNA binding protein